jgi:transketolase
MSKNALTLSYSEVREIEEHARAIRIRSLQMVTRAGASHIGSALSIVDILAVLYLAVIRSAVDPDSSIRDRCILSKGHAVVSLYATLCEIGVLSEEEIRGYGEASSRLMAHASHKVPGIEFSTGSLGHGLPFAVGKALAAKMRGEDWRCFVLMSDGELDEGSNWEALLFAAHHKLDNVTAIIDANGLQSLDTVEKTLNLEPIDSKLTAFGCEVSEVDGHSIAALYNSLTKKTKGPHVVVARTTKGKGVSFMENQVEWHYKNPTAEQLAKAESELSGA